MTCDADVARRRRRARPRGPSTSAGRATRATATTTTAASVPNCMTVSHRDAEARPGRSLTNRKSVDLEHAGSVHPRDRGTRAEHRAAEHRAEHDRPGDVRGRSTAHVAGEVAEQPRVEDALRELPPAVDECEPVAVLPDEDRVQAETRDLEHREVAARPWRSGRRPRRVTLVSWCIVRGVPSS